MRKFTKQLKKREGKEVAMKKATSQRRHAQSRLSERFGLDLSKKGYGQLCQQTRHSLKNNGVVEKQSHRVVVVKVDFKNELMLVVYDKNRKTVVTVLPPTDPL